MWCMLCLRKGFKRHWKLLPLILSPLLSEQHVANIVCSSYLIPKMKRHLQQKNSQRYLVTVGNKCVVVETYEIWGYRSLQMANKYCGYWWTEYYHSSSYKTNIILLEYFAFYKNQTSSGESFLHLPYITGKYFLCLILGTWGLNHFKDRVKRQKGSGDPMAVLSYHSRPVLQIPRLLLEWEK